jgi:hypothetical protein
MDTRKQTQKDTLGLTNRGISEAGFKKPGSVLACCERKPERREGAKE